MGLRSLVAAGLALTVASSARADEPAFVRVVVPACDAKAFDGDAFARDVTLELRAGGIEKVDILTDPSTITTPEPIATITIDAVPCTEDARELEIVIVDAITSKTVRRRLTFDDLGLGARPRVVALAAAELLRASWSELRLPDAPKGTLPVPPSIRLASMAPDATRASTTPPQPLPAAPPTPIPPSPPRSPFIRTDLAIEGRFFPTYGSALVGPNLALTFGSADHLPLRVRFDAQALFGTSYDPLGSISVHLVTGGLGVMLAHHAGSVDVEVGPHMELGWGDAGGSATNPTTTTASSGSAPILDASMMFALRLSVAGAYWASLASDVGEVIAGLDAAADGRRAAGFGGPVVGVAIGVGRGF